MYTLQIQNTIETTLTQTHYRETIQLFQDND